MKNSLIVFLQSMDDDFGVVKEEIVEEDCPLPCFNGRVISWLVSAGSVLSACTFVPVSCNLPCTCVPCTLHTAPCILHPVPCPPDGGSVMSDADTGSQCGQSDALSSLPPGETSSLDTKHHISILDFVPQFQTSDINPILAK